MFEVGKGKDEYFKVKRELRQAYVISPWHFKSIFDRVVRLMNEKAMGKEGGEKCILYASDTMLMVVGSRDPQFILDEFRDACDRVNLKINVDNSKLLLLQKD